MFRVRKISRIIIAHININSIRNKFFLLAEGVRGNINFFTISETKIDDAFLTSQFIISGFAAPFGFDRTDKGGDILLYIVYIRGDILSKLLKTAYIYDQMFNDRNQLA